MIFLGEEHLRRVVAEYLEYYHRERNHQVLDGRIIQCVELSSQHWRLVPRMEKSDDASVSAGCSITTTETRHDRFSFWTRRASRQGMVRQP